MPAKKSNNKKTISKKQKQSIVQRFVSNLHNKHFALLVFVFVFAVIGGSIMLFRSFAASVNSVAKTDANWSKIAAPLRQCESGNNYKINTGNGYYGAYQFSLRTWQTVGGSGYPHQASSTEQDSRARTLFLRSGLGQWPSCGKKIVNSSVGKQLQYTGGSAPANTGSSTPQPTTSSIRPICRERTLREGSSDRTCVTHLQDILRANGYDPGRSDGAFGPKTTAALKAFQGSPQRGGYGTPNALKADGIAGPQTAAHLCAFFGNYGYCTARP